MPGLISNKGSNRKHQYVSCLVSWEMETTETKNPRHSSMTNSCRKNSPGHTPSTAGTFRKKFRKNSGKTPETLSERFLEFLSRVRLGCPKPYNSRHLRLPERFQNSLPSSTAGDASFFRIGSGEGLSEPVMEFPAVLGVLLITFFLESKQGHYRGKKTIYLHRSGPLLENGLDRPKNRYGRYRFPSFYSISISTVGVDGARVCLWRFSFFALWVVVVDISQFPALCICQPLYAMSALPNTKLRC